MLGGFGGFDHLDRRIAAAMGRWGPTLLRWSLGIVFIWFGGLKPFGLSSADALIERTVYWLPADVFIPLLGWWEVAIGVGLLFRPLTRLALLLLFLQMPGTMLPLVLLPEVTFDRFPLVPTLEGQYIIKNLVLISAGLVIGGTVRRPEPASPPVRRPIVAARDLHELPRASGRKAESSTPTEVRRSEQQVPADGLLADVDAIGAVGDDPGNMRLGGHHGSPDPSVDPDPPIHPNSSIDRRRSARLPGRRAALRDHRRRGGRVPSPGHRTPGTAGPALSALRRVR